MKISYIYVAITIAFSIMFTEVTYALSVPPEIKNTVGFVYVLNQKGEKVPNGTGFFVGVKNQKKEDSSYVYFITAKHVLQTEKQDEWRSSFFLRLNKKDGKSELLEVPIIAEGKNKTVFIHKDPIVDIAVIPMLPDHSVFNFIVLSASMLTTQKDFKELNIREGSEVFFTGLFTPYPGYEKNYPVVRFGQVALITKEKIEINKKKDKANLYLIESGSFGGNSGSPVFFYLGSNRRPGSIIIGPPVLKIAGIMKGSFLDVQPLEIIGTSKILGAPSNMGISAVTPAYELHELLFGEELTKVRESKCNESP